MDQTIMPPPDAARRRAQLLVWWVTWGALLAGLLPLYFILARRPPPPVEPGANPFPQLVGFVPLFVSIVIRWLVLPRDRAPGVAFGFFVAGLGLAEMCGVLGLALGGPYREILFLLGVFGVTQFAPFYARRYFEPKVTGFIPNN